MYLLDTNVISELRKVRADRADRHVAAWAGQVDATDLYLSVISIQELEIGVLLAERKDARQGALLRAWMQAQVLPTFKGRILVVDTPVALRSAQLHAPDPRPVRDGLIAATALVHGMTVVTRNTSDFMPCGVSTLNPWEYDGP